jgi:hypothetical protein
MYQLLLTEPHAPTVCDQLEVILRRAIAELESQEPVAWVDPATLYQLKIGLEGVHLVHETEMVNSLPLYDKPQRTWVWLTPEEILDVFDRQLVYGSKWMEFARAVEAKLKEKNT